MSFRPNLASLTPYFLDIVCCCRFVWYIIAATKWVAEPTRAR